MRALFAMTVFWAAALLFIVEPMFARMLLPRLGGAPAVWNTAMVFYQAALLAGYGLAHLVATRLRPRWQALAQILLMTAALAVLPLGIGERWVLTAERNPIPWMLVMMTATLGLPFLALSTLSPLLQRWFAACGARNPYWLYAASNAGSLIGLLAYPLVIEPWLGLRAQSCWWSGAQIVLAALVVACALMVWKQAGLTSSPVATEPMRWQQRWRWMLLAFAPSSLMLSVTTYLSMEVGAMPLLWVVPLAIYLVTFILVFAQRQWLKLSWMTSALPWVVLPLTVMYGMRVTDKVLLVGGWNLLMLFVGAMICHGRLAAERPAPERLTEFYWWVSVGGVLGGVFNALVAPVAFRWVAEYPVSVALVCLLAWRWERMNWRDVVWPAALGVGGWLLGQLILYLPTESATTAILFKLAAPAAAALVLRGRSPRFGLAVAALFAAATWLPGERARVLLMERSFFGVHRVRASATDSLHRLAHGTTTHGIQNLDPNQRHEPLGYYSRVGPVGQLVAAWRQTGRPLRHAGVVGLGAGALAAYAQTGEDWTFFEIDPVVEKIARDPRLFTYLRDSPGNVRVVLGDARLSLQQTTERFDLLLMDAYSSDSIPLHLLTREAVQLYLERLQPQGWLAFHISNRHFRLEPVIAALAADAGLACRVQMKSAIRAEDRARGVMESSWAVLSRREVFLGTLAADSRWRTPVRHPNLRLWTDDYASVLSVWK